ncbi:LysE family translocator [Flavobacterium sp. W21_SRS_FM6]|uniref:LysE family translocator n=1 Tax=Flavobacterium sp. W21_SRS_FM6 TaxID=3240268 RepID=UPI003F8F8B0C
MKLSISDLVKTHNKPYIELTHLCNDLKLSHTNGSLNQRAFTVEYSALILFTIASSITPGPNNLMIMTSGVNYGFRRSLPHLLGIDIGFVLMIIGVGLGISQLFAQIPELLIWLKIAGIMYLGYLAYRIATSPTTPLVADVVDEMQRKPLSFLQAALFQWVNPKAWIMIVGAIVTYTNSSLDYTLQVGIIALFFLCLGTPCTFMWLGFGTALKRYLANSRHLKIFNIVMASLLMLSLLPVILELFTMAIP